MATAQNRLRIGRKLMLTLGTLFLLVALWESVLGGLSIASLSLLNPSAFLTGLHWFVGIVALACFFVSDRISLIGARIVGAILVVVGVLELVGNFVGGVFGPAGNATGAYILLHIVSGAGALYVSSALGRKAARGHRATA